MTKDLTEFHICVDSSQLDNTLTYVTQVKRCEKYPVVNFLDRTAYGVNLEVDQCLERVKLSWQNCISKDGVTTELQIEPEFAIPAAEQKKRLSKELRRQQQKQAAGVA